LLTVERYEAAWSIGIKPELKEHADCDPIDDNPK